VTQTVTIGTEVYEFVAAADDVQKENIAVVLGETLTADNAVTELAKAINASSALVTAIASTKDDTVVVEYKTIGTDGNNVAVAETCTSASWGDDVEKLSGGSLGTPSMLRNVIVYAHLITIGVKKKVLNLQLFGRNLHLQVFKNDY